MTEIVAAPTTPQPAVLHPGWWSAGLTLAERCTLPGTPASAPETEERAGRRLERWRESHALGPLGQFERRLDAIGSTEAKLLALLAESPASLAGRAIRPEWAALAEAALTRVAHEELPDGDPVSWHVGFAFITAPFARLGWERLAACANLDDTVDLPELRRCFVDALTRTLVMLASRTLVLELNVLRVTDRLDGDTPQRRFWDFVRHFTQPAGLVALFEEYPVLARLLAQATDHAVDSWQELLRRFATDRPLIVDELYGGADPGALVEVAVGLGDSHQRGRSVALLRFGDGRRLVYKPRPLTAHVRFNEWIAWLNQEVPSLGLCTLRVLDRGDYGWVEFTDHRPCEDRAAVERYYHRQGALLALLHALDGCDFHFENLIASGDQPVLVDLEALFHPQLRAGPDLLADDPAMAAFYASVSRVGLLPNMVTGEDGAVLDMSGAGGDAGLPMPFKAAGWAQAGTDEMRLIREQLTFPGSQNRPRLGDVEIDPCEFATEFLAGFGVAYEAIAANRHLLTESGGLVSRFADVELRVVVRATRQYGMLLYESTHPDVLRDALDRDRVIDYLWAVSVNDPSRERLVELECADLWAGDIPFFATRPGSLHLWTSTGEQVLDLLPVTSLDRVVRKIGEFGPQDRGVQEWIIDASFTTRRASKAGVREPEPVPAEVGEPLADAVDPERALAAARSVGDRLVESAYTDAERVGWLGLEFIAESRWMVQPLRHDLFNGYPGVALFLSQLAALTGDDRYATLARRATVPLRQLADTITGSQVLGERGAQPAVFGSLPGLAYALAHVATNLGEPELLAPIEPFVAAVAPGVAGDEVLDVVGGSAGTLVAMLAIHRATGLGQALEVARACAERLVESALPQEHGVAWGTSPKASRPLTGFSHGAAGIGWALLRYADVTGERKYADVGLDAFRYERFLYLPEFGNWPDFRVHDGQPEQPRGAMHAWCHGSPGIGLARADCLRTGDPEVAADLDLALRSTLAAGWGMNHSLCHGEFGSIELLTTAIANGHPELDAERAARGARAVATIERLGPLCGTPGGVATPGLMVGLAGIGHGLLRLGFPEQVPSVLLLREPGC